MVEGRCRPRLALESVASLRSEVVSAGRTFDGNRAIQTGITGAIHLADAAGAERRRDFIGSESSAREEANGTKGTRTRRPMSFQTQAPQHRRETGAERRGSSVVDLEKEASRARF